MHDEDDKEIWDFATRDVKPIVREQTFAEDVPDNEEPEKKRENPKPKVSEIQQSVNVQEPQKKAGTDIDKRTAEKLRKGQIPIEARLDLHGFNQGQAYQALQNFIAQSHAAGKRCVLVITGKGVGEDGRRDPLSSGQGVLKRAVPAWLGEDIFRSQVLKTQVARPQHGGDGALYVLLRRQR